MSTTGTILISKNGKPTRHTAQHVDTLAELHEHVDAEWDAEIIDGETRVRGGKTVPCEYLKISGITYRDEYSVSGDSEKELRQKMKRDAVKMARKGEFLHYSCDFTVELDGEDLEITGSPWGLAKLEGLCPGFTALVLKKPQKPRKAKKQASKARRSVLVNEHDEDEVEETSRPKGKIRRVRKGQSQQADQDDMLQKLIDGEISLKQFKKHVADA